MLPCRKDCAYYVPGCHKFCKRWQQQKELMRREREQKKAYLKYYAEFYRDIIRREPK